MRIQTPHGLVRRPASVDVRRTRQVLVATRALTRNDLLTAGDVSLAWQDVTRLHGEPIVDPSVLVGWSPRRHVTEGTILTDAIVEPAPAVRPGQTVLVRYTGPGFEVRLEGVARERGHVGARIRVKTVPSGQILDVRVTGPGEAEVS